MSIYTGGGDKGYTSLLSGSRIPKNDEWVEAYGTLDELSAQLGFCRSLLEKEDSSICLNTLIIEIQRGLFRAGMQLSSVKTYWSELKSPITALDIKELEGCIDRLEKIYGLPRFFVSPGETSIGAALHVARTVCRRAERRILTAVEGASGYEFILQYINRLSDLLFSLSWTIEIRDLVKKELDDGNYR
ncbi:cob(I)yrinic acid a,c-diamide adenosyltransferase [Desulforhopalus sp. 52FAK]